VVTRAKDLLDVYSSLPYQSPEILSNSSYDGKTDIWSLACVIYELMTLRRLFTQNTLTEKQNKEIQIYESAEELKYVVKKYNLAPKNPSHAIQAWNNLLNMYSHLKGA
jgi:serine/threonine protein kinase